MEQTLVFSEAINAFSTFLTSEPRWIFQIRGEIYSIDKLNYMLKHNSSGKHNAITYSRIPDISSLRIVVRDDYQQTKVFDNVYYSIGSATGSFSPSVFYTDTQLGGRHGDKSTREDTTSFAISRASGTGIGEKQLFPARLRGKYLVADYIYNSFTGFPFTLPSISTTYRYSKI